jgi:hypothetical protein
MADRSKFVVAGSATTIGLGAGGLAVGYSPSSAAENLCGGRFLSHWEECRPMVDLAWGALPFIAGSALLIGLIAGVWYLWGRLAKPPSGLILRFAPIVPYQVATLDSSTTGGLDSDDPKKHRQMIRVGVVNEGREAVSGVQLKVTQVNRGHAEFTPMQVRPKEPRADFKVTLHSKDEEIFEVAKLVGEDINGKPDQIFLCWYQPTSPKLITIPFATHDLCITAYGDGVEPVSACLRISVDTNGVLTGELLGPDECCADNPTPLPPRPFIHRVGVATSSARMSGAIHIPIDMGKGRP